MAISPLLGLFALGQTSIKRQIPNACGHHCHAACGPFGLQGVQEDAESFVPPPAGYLPGGERSTSFLVNFINFPPEAEAAFNYAVDIWASLIDSPIAIRIDATWEPLGSGALAQAGLTGTGAAVSSRATVQELAPLLVQDTRELIPVTSGNDLIGAMKRQDALNILLKVT